MCVFSWPTVILETLLLGVIFQEGLQSDSITEAPGCLSGEMLLLVLQETVLPYESTSLSRGIIVGWIHALVCEALFFHGVSCLYGQDGGF